MKEFDLEKAKNGAAVCMRDGTPVKILDFEYKHPDGNAILYKYDEWNFDKKNIESTMFTDLSGKCIMIVPDELSGRFDLFMAPITGYMSTYRDENGNLVGGTVFVELEDCEKEKDRYEQTDRYHFFRYAKVELLDD